MSSWTYTTAHSIEVAAGGGSVISPTTAFSANHKMIFDDILPVSADFDLSFFLATLDAPGHLGILFADASGFKISLTGAVADASVNTFREFWVRYGSPSGGVPKINLVTTIAARLQVIAVGDPLP